MGILRAVRYLRGYRSFSVQGARPERFVNLCMQNGIPLWKQSCAPGSFSAYTTVRSAQLLSALAARSGVTLTLGAERGAKALFTRYRRRRGLFIGAAFLLVALFGMGQFIWEVQINGLETISAQEMTATLAELGIKKGVLRAGIDVRDTERRLMLRFDHLAFAAVNLSGTTATIELTERTLPPDAVADNVPYNVVAQESGYITRMEVYTGSPMVKAGDSVARGDVLISGVMDDAKGGSRLVHARGVVRAQRCATLTVRVPYLREILIPERTAVRRYLNIVGERLPLWFYRKPEQPVSCISEERPIPLLTTLSGMTLEREQLTLYRTEQLTLSVREAMESAQRQLSELETVELAGVTVLSRQMTGQELEDCFLLSCDYICEGIISVESQIFIEN